ncbi:hypothetical protein B0H11DRAFT_1768203 [Mycena galericulata]|nr:hypothetical protein B0H11DRAFT_1768203 [Mycena galericulata]
MGRQVRLTIRTLNLFLIHARHPMVIVDPDGRIVAVFVGKPDDPKWDTEAIQGACRAMDRAARKGLATGALTSKDRDHRRGAYLSLTTGVSFGGGQKMPGNLVHSKTRRRLIARLLKNKHVQRIAGFQSSAFAYWAPKIYREYADSLRQLFEKYPNLEHNFKNSIFPAATFNCSPDTVTFEHADHNNLPSGWCGVTSGGRFNAETSALFYMKQYKMMVEFPSGASGFILSGAVDHGNTPLEPGETRYSMTQYAAGGLFRWVKYAFKSAKALLAEKGRKAIRDAYDGIPGARWQSALDLFSKVDEIAIDRRTVFGDQ